MAPTNSPESGRDAHRVREQFIEIATAIILSAAALATSWSSYQAALWDGEQSSYYTKATGKLTEASRLAIMDAQKSMFDAALFANWLNARGRQDVELQEFYERQFRPDFKLAFDAWMRTEPGRVPTAPRNPFVMPEYRHAGRAEADQLQRDALATFRKGEAANTHSDKYVATTISLAMVLFFGGIHSTFKRSSVRLALIAIAAAFFVLSISAFFFLPVTAAR